MNIEQIDKNFSFESTIDKEGLVWHDARKAPFSFYGLHDPLNADVPFHRMPFEIAETVSQGVKVLNYHTAGGRIRFSTNSPYLAIKCETHGNISCMAHMPLAGSQGFDLYETLEDGSLFFHRAFSPSADRIGKIGYEAVKNLPDDGKIRHYTLNFPLYGTCKNLAIGIKEGSVLAEGLPYRYEKPVIFYGSSITQGGCASRPGNAYQSFLSSEFGFDFINLGFSGSAKGEDAMIEYLASLDPLVFVSDYDHNAPTAEHLQATLPKLYEAVRAAHPNLPFIFVSAPGMDTGRAKHDVVENEAKRRRAEGDTLAYFVDGAKMYEYSGIHCSTVDGCHPTDLGFFGMYEAIARTLRVIL